MTTEIQSKPRILCLHGFRTSGEIFKKQVGKWPESVLGRLDLVFLDGAYPAAGESGVEGYYDPPYYEWFQYSEDLGEYYNFDGCIAYIEDYMVKHGPFDGLMGSSQGAGICAALPGMQLDGVALTEVPKIKFVIVISGGKFGGSERVLGGKYDGLKIGLPKLAANAFSSPLKCPSLHFIGETDFLRATGRELAESFEEPIFLHHPEGHTIPRLDERGLKTMLSFIDKIETIEK
ncbi:uncharacterized protein LOC127803413 isoform X1 [Diospyros lotus]|uniref:uncharacterized protein LOC127803413 isoform X1 n=1 Tax=Diospyros lotus TaxID=55363 RepID=UPI00225A5D85|nr:uncharacterized protein LOC127803413 isoform X1 [Diospyros lotus]